ncbi:hypothetical protein Nepgr_009262 [Nepenthes gracilis]|uniref:RRM domain-containing protein n=1 Tax=Nepenthes gracilis TaxID=150966 RepID=A0AAD3XK00_NEPGR|nr:hypothetical protein Nepgr_009262 [Nepenthes gracilis]
MASGLDMSLDDLIKANKTSARGSFRGRGRSGPGPVRRFSNRVANRSAPYSLPMAPNPIWQHHLFTDQVVRASSIETGTKLYISNLDYGVSTEDIRELFSEVGDLKKYAVHYDRSGRSKGTAEVVFSRRIAALAAVKRYDNVQLDGKPMKIEIVGSSIAADGLLPRVNGTLRNPIGVPRSGQVRGSAVERPRGGRAFGQGRGRARGHGENISAEELDAELEKYHSESMQIN